MKILLVFLASSLFQSITAQWIDPHDMNTNSKKYFKKVTIEDNNESTNNGKRPDVRDTEDISLMYLKRVINLLLNSATIDKDNPKIRWGKFMFDTESEEFLFLTQFSHKQDIKKDELRKLDIVLSELFSRRISDDIFDTLVSTQEKFVNIVFNINTFMILGVSLCLYIAFVLLNSERTFWYISRYFIMIIFIIDYGYRYRMKYEEIEEYNSKIEFSSKCDIKNMSWIQYLFSSKKGCDRKIVMPLEVALDQVKYIIIVPVSSFGTAMGQFGKEMWEALPFPWNFLIFPIMLLFSAIILAIVITSMNDSPFKIKLMHLFHFEFGSRGDNSDRISSNTLDRLLDAVAHRPMLETARSSPQVRRRKITAAPKQEGAPENRKVSQKNDGGKEENVSQEKILNNDKTNGAQNRKESQKDDGKKDEHVSQKKKVNKNKTNGAHGDTQTKGNEHLPEKECETLGSHIDCIENNSPVQASI